MPPSTSGIAAYSAEVLGALAGTDGLEIDVFVDGPPAEVPPSRRAARDFVWMARRRPYDLTVYQLGNARCHDYMWGYLFSYPGLVVLHDAQLHQARAQQLLQRWEPARAEYRAEFAACHPDAPQEVTRLIEAGLGGTLFHHWPLIAHVVRAARHVAVHSPRLAETLREKYGVRGTVLPMGVDDPLRFEATQDAPRDVLRDSPSGGPPDGAGAGASRGLTRADVRRRLGLPDDAVLVAAFGGVTPEKRIPELLTSMAALAERHPRLHLVLVGAAHGHFDVAAHVATRGLEGRVHLAGFVPDPELPAWLTAADIISCLRWPTNRETSAAWLRAIAAGRPTIVTDLAHTDDIPALDPRSWTRADATAAEAPVAVAIDILDEQHSLTLALDRLAGDALLRRELGTAARRYFEARHTIARTADSYRAALARAAAAPAPHTDLPPHLTDPASGQLSRLLAECGVSSPWAASPAR